MNNAVITVIGFTLELYSQKFPGYMDRLHAQLDRFCEAIRVHANVEFESIALCYTTAHVDAQIAAATQNGADAILVIPLSYACSGVIVPPLSRTDIPLIIWNTQEAATIAADYDFDALLMNHVTQGTQDITSVLLREGRIFGMESGHYRDAAALTRLAEWFDAARALRFARRLRVGIMGRPFAGMDDFKYDPRIMAETLGFEVVPLDIPEFLALRDAMSESDIDRVMADDAAGYELAPDVTTAIHRMSIRLELALRRLVTAERLDALTLNFLDFIAVPGAGTLPFFGINKLIAAGLGYAGEGDVIRAGQMAMLRAMVGTSNFTEIFTIDYQRNRLLMTHMQECNPAWARRDRKIKLLKKDFWAPGIQPYVGMWFTLEPGPVTLVSLTVGSGNRFHYVAHDTVIVDQPPLPGIDIPHWQVQLSEPAGDFLTRYGMAGGPHHLIALPGHHTGGRLAKLAALQGLELRQL